MSNIQPRFPESENGLRQRTGRTGGGGNGSEAKRAQDFDPLTPSEGVAQRERGFDGAEVVVEHFVIEQDEIDFRGEEIPP